MLKFPALLVDKLRIEGECSAALRSVRRPLNELQWASSEQLEWQASELEAEQVVGRGRGGEVLRVERDDSLDGEELFDDIVGGGDLMLDLD